MSIDIDSVKPGDSVRFARGSWIDPARYGYSHGQWVRVEEVPGDETLTIKPAATAPADEQSRPRHNAGFGPAWFDDHRPAPETVPGVDYPINSREAWDTLPIGTELIDDDGWTYTKVPETSDPLNGLTTATGQAPTPDGSSAPFSAPWNENGLRVTKLPAMLVDGLAWSDEHVSLYISGSIGSISAGELAAGPAPRDLTTELAQVEDDRDVLAQVLSYALDRLPADERARVYGFWDARLAD